MLRLKEVEFNLILISISLFLLKGGNILKLRKKLLIILVTFISLFLLISSKSLAYDVDYSVVLDGTTYPLPSIPIDPDKYDYVVFATNEDVGRNYTVPRFNIFYYEKSSMEYFFEIYLKNNEYMKATLVSKDEGVTNIPTLYYSYSYYLSPTSSWTSWNSATSYSVTATIPNRPHSFIKYIASNSEVVDLVSKETVFTQPLTFQKVVKGVKMEEITKVILAILPKVLMIIVLLASLWIGYRSLLKLLQTS